MGLNTDCSIVDFDYIYIYLIYFCQFFLWLELIINFVCLGCLVSQFLLLCHINYTKVNNICYRYNVFNITLTLGNQCIREMEQEKEVFLFTIHKFLLCDAAPANSLCHRWYMIPVQIRKKSASVVNKPD